MTRNEARRLENMPPIECWVTSRPYAVVDVNSINGGAVLFRDYQWRVTPRNLVFERNRKL